MKLCSRLLMLCRRNLYEKCQIWVSEHNFREVRGEAGPWLMDRRKAHGEFLFTLIELLFAIYYGSGVMRRNVYSSAVFAGGRPLAVKFYLDRVVPHQPFLASEY